jgi:hypothetical protein
MILKDKISLGKGRDRSRLRSKSLLCGVRNSRICYSTSLLEGAAQGGAHFYPDHESARAEPVPFSTKKIREFRDIIRKIGYNRIGDPLLSRGTASISFKNILKIP